MPPEFDISSYLFPAGMALLVVVMLRLSLRRLRAKRGRRTKSGVPANALENAAWHRLPLESDDPTAHFSPQVKLHDMLRDLRADVATRIGLLQQQTVAARDEAHRLERAIARARDLGLSPVGDTLAALEEALAAAGADEGSDLLDTTLDRLSSTLAPAMRPRDRAAIWELAAAGHSAETIATQLELPLGDVELLLHLGPTPQPKQPE